jgi:hypothetical protein
VHALNINKDIYGRAEEDAVTAIFGGKYRAARGYADASMSRMRGDSAQTAGYLNATSSVLSAYGTVAKGWKTTNATTPAAGGNS